MIGALPETLLVGGTEYPIRSDYRTILRVFEAFNDPDLEAIEKWIVATYMIFQKFSCADDVEKAAMDGFDIAEAAKQINWFISAGKPMGKIDNREKPTYDWVQDEQMIFSAINVVAKREVREADYMHWWTFLGYFNEIGEGTFSYIVGIRNKRNKCKKLDKQEREFYHNNRELVDLKKPLTMEEQEQEDEFKSLLDEVIG